MSIGVRILIVIGGIIALAGFLVLAGFIVMWLWNWLMPKLFGLPLIGYWEAWGILVLSHILFGARPGAKHIGEANRKRKLHDKLRAMHDSESDEPEPTGS